METILYNVKPEHPEINFDLVEKSGNCNIMPGDKVLVGESLLFKNDKDTPWLSTLRSGTVVARYGILAYTFDKESAERFNDGIYGPYPDYLEIEMDEKRPTGDKKASSFTHSVVWVKAGKIQTAWGKGCVIVNENKQRLLLCKQCKIKNCKKEVMIEK